MQRPKEAPIRLALEIPKDSKRPIKGLIRYFLPFLAYLPILSNLILHAFSSATAIFANKYPYYRSS